MKDYYKILEVSEDASDEVIHMAYKALVKKYHPDSSGRQEAEELNVKIRDVNEAYSVLSDKNKRRQYDEQRRLERGTNQEVKNSGSPKTDKMQKEETQDKAEETAFKPKWYYSYPVLVVTFCVFPISLILSVIRLKSIKRQPKGYGFRTKLAVGVNLGLTILFLLGVAMEHQDNKWQAQYETYLSEGEYILAKEMLDDKSENSMSARYVKDYIDLYEQYGVEIDIEEIVQAYFDELDDKTLFDSELLERIHNLLPTLSEQQQERINEILHNVEEAKSQQKISAANELVESTTSIQNTEIDNDFASEADEIKPSSEKESETTNIVESLENETDIAVESKEIEKKDAVDNESSEFICADSDSRLLEVSDVDSFTLDEMLLAIDEIYARHGVIFENKYRDNYFRQRKWYQPTIAQDEYDPNSELSEIEKANIDFLERVHNGSIEIPSDLPSDNITIEICTKRKFSFRSGGNPISIYIDDKKIGEIGINEYLRFVIFLDPGKHELKVKYGIGSDSRQTHE